MRSSILSFTILGSLFAVAGCATGPVAKSSKEAAEAPVAADWEVAVEELLEASAPTSALLDLAVLEGRWSVVLMVASGSKQESQAIASGQALAELLFDGRLLEWRTTVSLGGREIESRTSLGFDRVNDRYELAWFSELSSAQRLARGHGNATRAGIVFDHVERQQETGDVLRTRTIFRVRDVDHFDLEQLAFDPASADWMTTRLTQYTRLVAN